MHCCSGTPPCTLVAVEPGRERVTGLASWAVRMMYRPATRKEDSYARLP